MRGLIEVVAGVLGLLGIQLIKVSWLILKGVLILAVLVGAGRELLIKVPPEWPIWDASWRATLEYAGVVFSMALDRWWIIGLILSFFWVMRVAGETDRIGSNVQQTKIAIVALLNYLEVGVETDASKVLRERGIGAVLRQSMAAWPFSMLFGFEFDDTLTSKAVRHGERVSLKQDMQELVRSA